MSGIKKKKKSLYVIASLNLGEKLNHDRKTESVEIQLIGSPPQSKVSLTSPS